MAYSYVSVMDNGGMAKKRDKREIRAYADPELAKLLATIASLQDISLSQLINDALELYLQQDKIQALIQKHSLDEINGEDEN